MSPTLTHGHARQTLHIFAKIVFSVAFGLYICSINNRYNKDMITRYTNFFVYLSSASMISLALFRAAIIDKLPRDNLLTWAKTELTLNFAEKFHFVFICSIMWEVSGSGRHQLNITLPFYISVACFLTLPELVDRDIYTNDNNALLLTIDVDDESQRLRDVRRFIALDISINHYDCLILAIRRCRSDFGLETVRLMIRSDIFINHTNNRGDNALTTALRYAVEPMKIRLVNLLIHRGARPTRGDSLLQAYIRYCYSDAMFEKVTQHLEQANDPENLVNKTNEAGETPAITALAYSGHAYVAKIIKALVEYGATDAHTTLFFTALKYHQLETMQWLIDSGYDVTTLNSAGQTPLQAALEHRAGLPVIFFLLAHGSRSNLGDKETLMASSTQRFKQLRQWLPFSKQAITPNQLMPPSMSPDKDMNSAKYRLLCSLVDEHHQNKSENTYLILQSITQLSRQKLGGSHDLLIMTISFLYSAKLADNFCQYRLDCEKDHPVADTHTPPGS